MAELDLVNLGKAAWEIIKDGKPNATAQSAYCQAMPEKKQLAWEELEGWKTKTFKWPFTMKTVWDDWWGSDPTIDIDFFGTYDFGGHNDKTPGSFLNNFSVWCKKCDVDWGWTVNVDATTQGKPKNVGTKDRPVGSLQLRVALEYKSMLESHSVQWAITCDGDGGFTAS